MTVATQGNGLRRLQARLWIDATESGSLSRLGLPPNEMSPRTPDQAFRSLVVQSTQWDPLQERLASFPALRPGLEWLTSLRSTERRLRWPASGRDSVGGRHGRNGSRRAGMAWAGAIGVISHASDLDFPIYSAQPVRSLSALPGNLCSLSPALNGVALSSISDRFLHG